MLLSTFPIPSSILYLNIDNLALKNDKSTLSPIQYPNATVPETYQDTVHFTGTFDQVKAETAGIGLSKHNPLSACT